MKESPKDALESFMTDNLNLDYSIDKELWGCIEAYAQKKYQEGELDGLRLATYCAEKDSPEEKRILNIIGELERKEQ